MDDFDLLQQYAVARSEAAFAELTRRYVNLVYSAGLRQVRDAAAAEDVTQVVFIVLANRAGRFHRQTVLSAWLVKAAYLASRNYLRTEGRRQVHERAASRREAMQPEASWEQLSPELDEALARLAEASRSAVMLRFIEGKSFREIAERLGVSEVAARQRVFRGLERLRLEFRRRGLSLSATGVGQMLASHALQEAPPHLAAQAAVAATGASASHLALAKGVITLMAWNKLKLVLAGGAAALLLVGGTATVGHHLMTRSRDHVLVVGPSPNAGGRPDGTLLATTTAGTGARSLGRVVTADGRPVANAEVILGSARDQAHVFRRPEVLARVPVGLATAKTRPDGRFDIALDLAPNPRWSVGVIADEGFAQATSEELQSSGGNLVLEPWGRLEGRARAGANPAAGFTVLCSRLDYAGVRAAPGIDFDQTTKVSPDGRYTFDRVVPGPVWVQLIYPGLSQYRFVVVNVSPGQTATLDLGSQGRTITGRVAPASAQGRLRGSLVPVAPPTSSSAEDPTTEPQPYQFQVGATGAFRIRDIPAGEYRITVTQETANGMKILATADAPVAVPPSPPEDQTPINVGDLTLRPYQSVRGGE
jgi:RNA polymerase sigma factor (sigma-70 family)